ncbi:MAG: caspase family protein [Candidatus Devosia phytovorans]|uniref:Caspase family protein n=1 Tax=Candidatus Devosia phytovorans TaxID=3121372 RepID=A0AAJ5VVC7_9HYPH|nr:caspase family protein [Devosia sp.]WEK04084.1 MAG: caspase family protein [Devosia sp.]
MPDKTLTLLGVHGLGDHRASDWKSRWSDAVRAAFPDVPELELDFQFVSYDDIFETIDISWLEAAKAFWKLAKSGASSIGRERGVLSDISDKIRWSAGYVVAWVEDEQFKAKARQRILEAVGDIKPDIILAHSLGSLVTYNAFSHEDSQKGSIETILGKADYITFGSQIGNAFVQGNLTNGRIQPLGVRNWRHLYNKYDDVFTEAIRLPDMPTFRQTDTPFDLDGIGDHAAESYLGHSETIENVWKPIALAAVTAPEPKARALVKTPAEPRKKVQKALLVGINDYPNPAQRLEGCINDVFTMSAVLQSCGVPPDAIRVCLDDRATTEGILSRLQWLVDDPRPGDELVFYYSGHGARVPEYGENFEPDHFVETLVPWDFDWTPERWIADDQIYNLYCQLPYETRLVMIFDCCHSGGIHRDGAARPRGIVPPDDIRHRELKWDQKAGMWVARDFARINPDFTKNTEVQVRYFGPEGATERLGRAAMLRMKQEKGAKSAFIAPYLPVIIEACGEDEFSYEYRHGATSHGAFTFSLDSILRRSKKISFEELIDAVRDQLQELGYAQRPTILGPEEILKYNVPWTAG